MAMNRSIFVRACLEFAFGDKKHPFFVDTRHFLQCIPFGTDKKSNEVSAKKGCFLAQRVNSKQALRGRLFVSYSLISFFGLCGLFFSMTACGPEKPAKSKRVVIEERVAKKIATWRSIFNKKCRKRAIEEATALVDSMLIANARAKKDTVGKPLKPLKPSFPEFEVPLDSTPIAPVIQGEKDTIK